MIVQIGGLLADDTLASLRQALGEEAAGFKPGAATAGWHARPVKHNEQASGAAAAQAVAAVKDALGAHPVFNAVARPKALVGLLVSRYGPGMEYGTHVDNAMMNGIRTDLSFTVFLAPPEAYDGGWVTQADAGPILRENLAKRLAADGIAIEDLAYTATTVQVRIRNGRIDAGSQAIGRTARALSHVMPASVEVFEIVPVVNGIGVSKVTIRRSDLEALEYSADNATLLRERTRR